MTPKKCLFGFVLLGVFVLAGVLTATYIGHQREQKLISENDQRIAEDVQRRLTEYLQNLPADHPVTMRYGQFHQLVGSGHRRVAGFPHFPSIEMARTARFEKASARCLITVSGNGPVQFNLHLSPPEDWIADNPRHRLVKKGNELIHIGPGTSRPTELKVAVRHPEYADTIGELRQVQTWRAGVEEATNDFVAGVMGDERRSLAARQWYDSQRATVPIELFVQSLLKHSDDRVRIRAIRLLGQSRPGQKLSLPVGVKRQLLSVVADVNNDQKVRSEAVRTMLQLYEPERKELYEVLAQLGEDGHFAAPLIGEFLVDKSQSHWQESGAGGAPTGAAELLEQWGAAAAPAAEPLMVVVEEHPNRWDFVPAAARALGAIGLEGARANKARKLLNLAKTDQYGSVRKAAQEAFRELPDPGFPPVGAPIRFLFARERERFYPLANQDTFSWLSPDGKRLLILRSEVDGGDIYTVDVQTARCRHLCHITCERIVAATGSGDDVLVLHMDANRRKLILDTWSPGGAERLLTRTLCELHPVEANQQTGISHVVWSNDRKRVAFTQYVRTSRDRGHTQSCYLQVKRVDAPEVRPDERLSEYLLVPLRFSADGNALFLHGWYFAARADAIVRLELATGEIESVRTHARSLAGLPWERGRHNLIPIRKPSSTSQSSIELVDADTRQAVTISLDRAPVYLDVPWEIAYAIHPSGECLALVTQTSVDVYHTRSGALLERQPILSPTTHYSLAPMFLSAHRDGFVLAVTFRTGPQRLPPSADNELRVIQVNAVEFATGSDKQAQE